MKPFAALNSIAWSRGHVQLGEYTQARKHWLQLSQKTTLFFNKNPWIMDLCGLLNLHFYWVFRIWVHPIWWLSKLTPRVEFSSRLPGSWGSEEGQQSKDVAGGDMRLDTWQMPFAASFAMCFACGLLMQVNLACVKAEQFRCMVLGFWPFSI